MTQQVWNFATIHATIGTLRGNASTIQAGNEQAEAALGKGVAAWQGEASEMWAMEQQKLNSRGEEFKIAVDQYLAAVEEATHGQENIEKVNMASFG
ncbi:hypothetical protein ACNUDN_29040 [Mycobacterium sp. smrl_JER01]|uniref:WXG100 family type VII secretion target n=2 Tax=Mycolicibacterium TaxID=1866885 RepID=A0ABT4HKI9_MYCIR|nr:MULTISPECIES: hypothetical protein [Mycobacteriaceae]MCZ0730701.1 hypothetical protein [Mycolicibacterium iranicum]GAY16100.1 hypothetical protein MSZK_28260 [Mycobacterium sp. shizuoka-1]